MKKIVSISAIMILMAISADVKAQDTDKSTKQEVKKGAKKVGNKTAEIASKGKAKVTDERYKDKVGPNGETIYIDNHNKYYWVDKKGRRHYIPAEALKNKM
jgi:hypothetical protein